MIDEWLIVGFTVTTKDNLDSQQLPDLIKKAKKNNFKAEKVIVDITYVNNKNLNACGEEIEVIVRTNTAVTAMADTKFAEVLDYNIDTEIIQYLSKELSTYVEKMIAKNGKQYNVNFK